MKAWHKNTDAAVALESEDSNETTAFSLALVFLTLGFSLCAFAVVYWEIGQSLMLTSGLLGIAIGGWNLHQYLGKISDAEG